MFPKASATAALGQGDEVGTLTREVQRARTRGAIEVPSIDDERHTHEWAAAQEAARSAKASLCTRTSASGNSLKASFVARVARAALSEGGVTGGLQREQGEAAAQRDAAQPDTDTQARNNASPRLGHERSGTKSCFVGAHKHDASSGSARAVRRVSLSASAPALPELDAARSYTRPPRSSAPVHRNGATPWVVLSPRASTAGMTRLLPLLPSASQPLLTKRAVDPGQPQIDCGKPTAQRSRAAAVANAPIRDGGRAWPLAVAGRLPLAAGASPPRRVRRVGTDCPAELLRALDKAEARLALDLRVVASSHNSSSMRRRVRGAFGDLPSPPTLERQGSQRGKVRARTNAYAKWGVPLEAISGEAGPGEELRPKSDPLSAPAAGEGVESAHPGDAGSRGGAVGVPEGQAVGGAAPSNARARNAARRREVISLYELHQLALNRSMSMAVLQPGAVESCPTFLDFGRVLELHYPRATRWERGQMLRLVAAHEEAASRSRRRAQVNLHRSNIVEVFGKIDLNGSGGIDLRELLAAAVRVGLEPDEAEALRERFVAVQSGGKGATQGGGAVAAAADVTIDVDQFTELLVENEVLIKLMDGVLVEGRAERELAERRQQGILVGRGRAPRWHGACQAHRPCLADLKTDRQREELLEQHWKRGPMLSP